VNAAFSPDNLPAQMRNAPRWLAWKLVPEPGRGKPRKVPYYPNGRPRSGALDSPEELAQLGTLAEAQALAARGGYAGVGFALGPDGRGGTWQGIDLDGVSARPTLAALVPTLPGYIERSPSGDGWHAIGYGPAGFQNMGSSSNNSGVEAYAGGRFFTVTGHEGRGELCDLSGFVADRIAPLHAGGRKSATVADSTPPSPPEGAGCIFAGEGVVADLRSALDALKPHANDYDLWIALGNALKDPALHGEGEVLWLDWSASDQRFNAAEAERKWAGFKPERTGYAAVFSKATELVGWVNPRAGKPPASGEGPVAAFRFVSVSDLIEAEPPAPSFWIADLLPERVVTLLGAHGGTGKTMLGLVAAVCLATGRPFMGKETKRARVVFFSGEDPAQVLRWRLAQICREMSVDPHQLDGWLTVIDATEGDPTLFTEVMAQGARQGVTTRAYAELRKIGEGGAEVFIVDNASDAYDADENVRARVRGFIRSLALLVREQAGAVLLLAHVDKSTARNSGNGSGGNSEGYSGSTAWHNSVRSRLFMSVDDQGLLLEHQKSNLGKRAEPIRLQWSERGVLVLESPGTGPMAAGCDEDREAVLGLIDEFYMRGEHISPALTSPNNAFKVLSRQIGFPKRLNRDRLFDLLRAAQRDGLLEVESYRNASRHDALRWRVTGRGAMPDYSDLF